MTVFAFAGLLLLQCIVAQTSRELLTAEPCQCDVVRHACDANCCCDADCSPDETALFTACLPTGAPAPELNYCLSEDSVAKVRPADHSVRRARGLCWQARWRGAALEPLQLFADQPAQQRGPGGR